MKRAVYEKIQVESVMSKVIKCKNSYFTDNIDNRLFFIKYFCKLNYILRRQPLPYVRY